MASLQAAVLVVLHEVMVRIPRKGQRVEPERVDDRFLEQTQVWIGRFQVAGVEGDEVVSQHEICRFRKPIQGLKRVAQIPAPVDTWLRAARTNATKAVNTIGLGVDFEIDRHAPFQERVRVRSLRMSAVVQR